MLSIQFKAYAMPYSNNECQSGSGFGSCSNWQGWTGISTHGAMSDITLDNPQQFSTWSEYIELKQANGTIVQVGLDYDPTDCSSFTNMAFFYYDTNKNTKPVQAACALSGDINHIATFGISYYSSNGGGFFFWVLNTAQTGNVCNPCSIADASGPNVFTSSFIQTNVQVFSFTGHLVWGSEAIDNKYFNNGVWAYDGTTGSITSWNDDPLCNGSNGNASCHPPQMFWHSVPNGSANNGGTLYFCDYDSQSNACTLGS